VVFWQKRPFTRAEFRQFMFAQSKPFTEMIELVRNLKAKYKLKVFVVSNEAREVNAYRIRQFKLDGFVDAFISSCFVHLRKPDADIFRLALDIARCQPGKLFISKTRRCSFKSRRVGDSSILHTDYKSTAQNWPRSDYTLTRSHP
jgi:phosphoglycolate phosphatase-like HAD superfamily hydrolase